MRNFALLVFIPFVLLVAGCAALDTVAGVDAKGNKIPGPSPLETAGNILNYVIPGAAAAAGAASTAYAALRGRKWKTAMGATIEAVNAARAANDGGGKIAVDGLMQKLGQFHDGAGVRRLVRELAHKIEGKT